MVHLQRMVRRHPGLRSFLMVLLSIAMVLNSTPTVAFAADSSNLNGFITDVSFDGLAAGEQAKQGKTYGVTLSFSEADVDDEFVNTGDLTYTMPKGFKALDHPLDYITIKVDDGGTEVLVNDNQWYIEGNKLHFSWNESDPNYATLITKDNAKINFVFDGQFDGSEAAVNFGGGTAPVPVNTSHEVTLEKQASVSWDGKAQYNLTVKSNGTNTNVRVSDLISGSLLTLNPDSITSNPGDAGSYSVDGNGFTYTIDSMGDGDSVTISYTANIDYNSLEGTGTVEETGNSASVTSTEDGEGSSASKDLAGQLKGPSTTKSGKVVGSPSGNKQTVEWTVTVNPEQFISMNGKTVTDTLQDSFVSYSGDGIKVQRQQKNEWSNLVNSGEPYAVSWSELGVTDASTSFDYTFDDADAYAYVITYTTEVDFTGKTKPSYSVSNVASGIGDDARGTVTVGNPGDSAVNLGKAVVSKASDGTDYISWKVTFNVPATGLSSAVLEDTYPSRWMDSNQVETVESLDDIVIDGLVDGETVTRENIENNGSIAGFKFTFANGSAAGLKGTGSTRPIIITYSTKVSQAWLEADYAGNNSPHTNSVKLTVDGEDSTASAQKVFTKTGIKKSGSSSGEVDGMPTYTYEVVLSGVNDSVLDDNGKRVKEFMQADPVDLADAIAEALELA